MPNWTRVDVIPKDMKSFKQSVESESSKFDFNKVLPMPKDLDITSGWCTCNKDVHLDRAFLEAFSIYLSLPQDDFVDMVKKHISPEQTNAFDKVYPAATQEEYETYWRSLYNLNKYHQKDWYDWRNKVWGTKWNACDIFADDYTYSFNTAWDYPTGVLNELAKKHDFVCIYSYETSGSGILEAKDGELHTVPFPSKTTKFAKAFDECCWSPESVRESDEYSEEFADKVIDFYESWLSHYETR